MKLVPKLASAFVAGTFLVLAANAYFRVTRETAVLQTDRADDHALLGGALEAAVVTVWHSDGRNDALNVVAGANARGARVHARWIDRQPSSGTPDRDIHVEASALDALRPLETLTRIEGDKRYSYTPVIVDNQRVGLIELSESLDAERRAKRTIVSDTIMTTLTMIAVCSILSIAFGIWIVGKPVRDLCEKARRIGRGDFSGPLKLSQQDELGMLATEVNAMSAQLLDATRRAENETAARIATLEQLRHADRLMTVGMLASGVAHELGTPLNVVSARARMITAKDCTDVEKKDYANVIAEAADRMAKIIRQLLAFARRKSPQKAPRDLRRVVIETCELLKPIADKNRVRFELATPTKPLTPAESIVDIDADGIQQALTNILINAVHAMPNGGAIAMTLESETRSASDEHPGHFAVLRVSDEGTGITPENLTHIFEPFFTTKGVGQGTGLGLSVTHGIILDHQGFLDVKSEIGKGSVFAIHLPVKHEP